MLSQYLQDSPASRRDKMSVTRETDAEVRAASLLVLQQLLSGEAARKFLSDASRELPQIQHWTLLAIFDTPPEAMDHEVEIRMCELEVGPDKAIKSLYSKVELTRFEKFFRKENLKVLGSQQPYRIQASPLQLKQACDGNAMNGRAYDHPVHLHCQHWVKEVLRKFGLKLPVHDLLEDCGWAYVAGLAAVQKGLRSLRKVQGGAEEEEASITVKWMFADSSVICGSIGARLAEINPLRWSSKMGFNEAEEDLKQNGAADRPITMKLNQGGFEYARIDAVDARAAIARLKVEKSKIKRNGSQIRYLDKPHLKVAKLRS